MSCKEVREELKNEGDICCESCYQTVEGTQDICYECGRIICEQCLLDFGGYCSECYDFLLKENEEDKRRLWNDFWSSRL